MAILRGKNILDRVRRKIKNSNYSSYQEINEAQAWIAAQTPFNWLRKSNILGSGLVASTKEYDLNLGSVRSIQTMWIAASDTTSVGDIEGITLTSTDPVSVKITAHGLASGRQVIFDSVGGTTELEDNTYKITVTDVDNFTLIGTDSSDFTAWTSGGDVASWDIDDGTWDLMTESPGELFETRVKETSNQVNNVNNNTVQVTTTELDSNRTTAKWTYYLKSGDSNPFMKFVVSPTPSKTYKLKIDYIRDVNEISEETIPDTPVAHIDALVFLAAGYILETSDKKEDVIRGLRYIKRAEKDVQLIMQDSHRNRSGGIDRPLSPWKV